MTSSRADVTLKNPPWVKEMRAHRERTGSYRTQDVLRVLGDPRKSVIVTATGSFVTGKQAIGPADQKK